MQWLHSIIGTWSYFLPPRPGLKLMRVRPAVYREHGLKGLGFPFEIDGQKDAQDSCSLLSVSPDCFVF
jgi:hypothetical protein